LPLSDSIRRVPPYTTSVLDRTYYPTANIGITPNIQHIIQKVKKKL